MNTNTLNTALNFKFNTAKLTAIGILITILLAIGSILVSQYQATANIEAMKVAELNDMKARRAGDIRMAMKPLNLK